jgi:hypothetical protein
VLQKSQKVLGLIFRQKRKSSINVASNPLGIAGEFGALERGPPHHFQSPYKLGELETPSQKILCNSIGT